MGENAKSLVVIDDSPVELLIYKALTKEFDCNVFITESFEEAIDHCSTHKVDVLITDLNLNEKSGLEVIAAAKNNPSNSEMRSFVCSSESPVKYKPKLKESNTGWIVKPVEADSMKRVLQKLLS